MSPAVRPWVVVIRFARKVKDARTDRGQPVLTSA